MNETTKQCPLCAEDIPLAADECPYCAARFKISSDGYCLKCHAFRQADESGNCQTCGEPVTDWRVESTFMGEALEVTPPVTPPPGSAPAATPPPTKPVRWWIFAAILAGLLALAGLGWLLVRMTADRFLSQAPVTTPSQAGPLSIQNPATNTAPLPTLTRVMTPTATPTLAPTPTPTLGIGSRKVAESDGMTLLYVPAGEFLRGQVNDKDNPQRTVYLDAFWIDQTEVTNAMYAKCVAAGACQPPALASSASHPAYYGAMQFEDYPVIRVSSADADAYCRWAGRQLPTGEQWEKAARGVDGRTYPWGNQEPTCELANGKSCVGDTNKVGSYPAGASPYGALDMVGNVNEWTDEIRKFPLERGGDFFMGTWPITLGFGVAGSAYTIGFRCAMPAD